MTPSLVAHWPFALPLTVALALALVWRASGRDVPSGPVKPEYAPPPGLTPAEGGTLLAERAALRHLLATLIDLAVRGYLTVDRTAADATAWTFRPARSLDDPGITALERVTLQRVFGENLSLPEGVVAELAANDDEFFTPVADAIYRSLVARRLFVRSPFWVRQGWLALGIVVLLVAWALALERERFGAAGGSLALATALTGAIVIGFAPLMPRRTRRGVRLAAELRGFQDFLERTGKDRWQRLEGEALDRELAWAVALGVVAPEASRGIIAAPATPSARRPS